MEDTYLKRQYGDRYRTARGEDGIWNIQTRIPPRNGLDFDVYAYGRGTLAALLPPRMANNLLSDNPEVFRLHQNAEDAKVLLFPEEELDRFADRLKLRRRKRLSEENKVRATERLRPFHFKPHVTETSQA